ncbi:MAG TPA: WecB/TagA/CpsF family glycosyltransferase [Candidatus Methylomirabilis sp.]|nr:WecB/TagA/CpsF family glycosyltransferase [Candidatus Methylomirabilis sp.]
MNSPSFDCFGVRIDGLDAGDILRRADEAPALSFPLWIVTTNPEILLYARANTQYRDAIHLADLRIVDGFGLQLAGLLRGRRLRRTAGVDLAQRLVDRAAERGDTVAFVGGGPGVASQALERQRERHPALKGYAFEGGRVNNAGEGDTQSEEMRHQVSIAGPDVLFVAFGHPKQEMWIARYLHEFPSVRIVMGVGGTFDYWSGRTPRAPRWMRSHGLEWMYRLFRQPGRIKRILQAVFIFPFFFLIDLFRSSTHLR